MRQKKPAPEVSIVIPALNEEKYIGRLLKSIRSQGFRDYEIIVADAGSKDRTTSIAKRYCARIVKGGLPGVGRNRGAEAAKSAILVFLDADVVLPKDFLQNAIHEMEERFLDLATCEFHPISNLLIDRVLHNLGNLLMRLNQDTNPHAPGFCIIVTKRLFQRTGGFDESVVLAEDHDFVRRASRFRPLRVLESVRIRVSVRRLKKEGRLALLAKYLRAEMHIMARGEIKDNSMIEYEFGDFSNSDDKGLHKKLRRIEKRIESVNRRYRRLKKRLSAREDFLAQQKWLKSAADNLKKEIRRIFA